MYGCHRRYLVFRPSTVRSECTVKVFQRLPSPREDQRRGDRDLSLTVGTPGYIEGLEVSKSSSYFSGLGEREKFSESPSKGV